MRTAHIQQQNDAELLRRLDAAGVEFVVIGGVSAVYHGIPIPTFDLDVCASFTEENLMKIQRALDGLKPIHRLAANRLPLELTPELCTRLKNLYLDTTLGTLDILSEVAGIGGYEKVNEMSFPGDFPSGRYLTLKIDALIQSKEAAGREKDLRMVGYLKALRDAPKIKPNS